MVNKPILWDSKKLVLLGKELLKPLPEVDLNLMNKNTKIVIGLVVVILLIWGIASKMRSTKQPQNTSSSSTKTTEQSSFKVGIILPLTGDAASYGEPGEKVFRLATEEVNNSGGVDGKKLELVVEDGKCNGKDATNAAQKLVNVDKVQVIIGGFCSSESLAAVPVAAQGKVAIMSIGSSSPALTGVSPYFWRIFPSDASQGSLGAEQANKRGYKKVAFLQEQLDYPLGIYKAFDARFKELGGTTIKEEFAPATTDFRTQLTKLKAQNPDALFIDGQASPATGRILKQLKDLGWKPQLFINEATAGDSKAIMENKDLLEGAIGAEFTVDTNNTKFSHLLEAYKMKFNEDLPFQSYGQTEYDSIFLVRDAIKAVGYNGEKIANWSRTIKDWEGASGKITVKADGDRASGYTTEVVKNGKMTVLAEDSMMKK